MKKLPFLFMIFVCRNSILKSINHILSIDKAKVWCYDKRNSNKFGRGAFFISIL
jgi:hypothetical protein